jgi:hypothetical protein
MLTQNFDSGMETDGGHGGQFVNHPRMIKSRNRIGNHDPGGSPGESLVFVSVPDRDGHVGFLAFGAVSCMVVVCMQ